MRFGNMRLEDLYPVSVEQVGVQEVRMSPTSKSWLIREIVQCVSSETRPIKTVLMYTICVRHYL